MRFLKIIRSVFVIRPWLLLGKYQDTFNLPQLQAQSIGAMLQFAEPVEQPGITTLYLPLEDGYPVPEDIFRQGLAFILTHYQQKNKVLISCGAGISRSVAFVVAALKETEQMPLLEAYQTVLNVHSKALPHPAIWQSFYWRLLKQYNKKE